MVKKGIEDWTRHLDRLPADANRYSEIEGIADGIARFYGFDRIALSPLESAASFLPLVRAGMLDERPPVRCRGQSGEEFFLAPSGALGALRAYGSHRMHALPHPVKLFFHARGFSLASPAATEAVVARGEWGAVAIGEESVVAETEIAQIFYRTAAELGISDSSIELRINAVGCAVCRTSFRASLGNYFRRHAVRLCSQSRRDLKRVSTLTRILSCGEERCGGVAAAAPQVLDFLCERCKKQLRRLLEFLDEAGIPYLLDPRFFRDGSWYTEVIFELLLDRLEGGASPVAAAGGGGIAADNGIEENDERSSAYPSYHHSGVSPRQESGASPLPSGKRVLAEGGRISQAAALIGGKEVSAAAGVLLLDAVADAVARREAGAPGSLEVFFAQLGDLAKRRSFEILEILREAGFEVRESLGRDSIKTQLKIAERLGAKFALILGQKEALDSTIIVREVSSGIQETVSQEKLADFLKKKLKK
ncbi:MAG: ATP phosphoribosyltransferase regulatory subunit [Patescibacteria group bacterium]